MFIRGRKGQLSVIVIVALVILAGVVVYFVLKNVNVDNVPSELEPVYAYYSNCIESTTKDALKIAGIQGGRIYLEDYQPGSAYSPFGNQLRFLGNPVSYWHNVGGNGVVQDNVPALKDVEKDVQQYLEINLQKCNFNQFKDQGFFVTLGDISAEVTINDNVEVNVKSDLSVSKGENSGFKKNHNVNFNSNFNSMYQTAKEINDKENSQYFLENYAIDSLYLYAPVVGSELSCSPLIWTPSEVFKDIDSALETNIQLIKIKGDYYSGGDDYYTIDLGKKTDKQIRFLYSRDFPGRFEVWPTQNNLMLANPVGTQEGISSIGFCYVSYKFVYDLYFPVLIQVYDGDDIFQYASSVVINKNQARNPIVSDNIDDLVDVCENANTDLEINTYTTNLDSVESDIEFSCLNDRCHIGKTKIDNSTGTAKLIGKVPQCTNGILIARTNGYKETRELVSTNEESSVDLFLEKNANLSLEIYVDGKLTNDLSVLIIKDKASNTSKSFAYPYTKNIEVAPGYYEFDLKVYGSGSVTIPGTTIKQCNEVPNGVLGGFFGITKEDCRNVQIPGQTISSLLYSGGTGEDYFVQSQIYSANTLKINADSLGTVNSINDLQNIYTQIESKKLDINLI